MEITDLFTLLSGPTPTQHEGWGLCSMVVLWLCDYVYVFQEKLFQYTCSPFSLHMYEILGDRLARKNRLEI